MTSSNAKNWANYAMRHENSVGIVDKPSFVVLFSGNNNGPRGELSELCLR